MNKRIALMMPGQGSQFVGMGKDFYDAFDEARSLYKTANRTLGFDIADLCFEGDLGELTKTHNAQPAILLHSLVVLEVLRGRNVHPSVVAGHSLGEFSALVAAGFFKPMDALLIVRRRGELMYEAGLEEPGTMAAIIGSEEKEVAEFVEAAAGEGVVVIANYNCPGQYAISGEVAAVDKALEIAQANGAKRAMRLQVSGAFHSPLMERTAGAFADYIAKFETGKLRVPWIANVTGNEITDQTEVIPLLSRQLSSPVLWSKSMQTLMANHNGPVLEVGPGRVLSGLLKRIERRAEVVPLTEASALETVAELET